MRKFSHKPALVRCFHRLVRWAKWAWIMYRVYRAIMMLAEAT